VTQPDRDDLTDKAHLYRGLSQPPSAHSDPPASAVGPTGLREDPDAAKPAGPDPLLTPRAARAPREALSYDTVRPRGRGPSPIKLLVGAAALTGAAFAYFFLHGFGLGTGHGGTSPGPGGASPTPPAAMQATPPTHPTSLFAPLSPGVVTSAPTEPLHLAIVNESYHIGTADGKEIGLEEALALAKTAKPGSPVYIDLNGSSRAAAEDHLRSAFEQQQIPIIWTQDGKPLTGDLPGSGKRVTPGDAGDNK